MACLFYSLEEGKEKSCCQVCVFVIYLLFDLDHLPYRLHLINNQIFEDKTIYILNDFWFQDFLLVMDVIKLPGTYFNK